jgi:hypothetical protein
MPSEAGIKLRDDAQKARLHFEACIREHLHRIDELPSLPRIDGTTAVQIAAKDLKDAIDTYTTAKEVLASFLNLHPEEGLDGPSKTETPSTNI